MLYTIHYPLQITKNNTTYDPEVLALLWNVLLEMHIHEIEVFVHGLLQLRVKPPGSQILGGEDARLDVGAHAASPGSHVLLARSLGL
jgi:hypothetical protein